MAKRNNKIKGNAGEKLAEEFLKKKGLRLLARNYSTEFGEVDLVVTDDSTLIFVEVKTRFDDRYGAPAEAVTSHKQVKISQVAAQYINRFGLYDVPVRFDVVEVYLNDKSINHIEGAFDSYLRY